MGSPYGELVFAVDNNPPQGFTNTDANRDQVKDEIVIRELLQNALDSGTGTRAVRFVLDEVAASSIFGIDRYREASSTPAATWQKTSPHRQADDQAHPESAQQGCSAVLVLLRRRQRDRRSGVALAVRQRTLHQTHRRTRIRRTWPPDIVCSQRPSLCALRRTARGVDGALSETFGGHAIVASHIVATGNGNTQRSANGFIRQRRAEGQEVLFDHERGGTRIPRALARRMGEGSGSAVMIAAYKPVAPNVKPEQLILAAAARHFLVAVFDGTLNVTFEDSPVLSAR